jgi:hypothetical protein
LTNTPVVMERPRCALARQFFFLSRVILTAAIKLAPRTHPWRILVESTTEDVGNLTETTLFARQADGIPDVHLPSGDGRRIFRLAAYSILLLYFAYSVLDDLVVDLPTFPSLFS